MKTKEKLRESDINKIMLTLINRGRFHYQVKDILAYIAKCVCIRKLEKYRQDKNLKVHYIFDKCENRLNEELDVLTLLKQAR